MKIEKRIGAALTASALALGLFATPLESVPFALGTTVSAQEQIVSEYISVDTSSLPDSRELEEAYINKLFYGGGFSFYKDYGKNHLDGTALEVYNELRAYIEAVANGDSTSTVFPITRTTSFDQAQTTLNQLSKDVLAVWRYLLVDLPEDFYWFDKTKGVSTGLGDQGGSQESYTFTLNVTFCVSQDYMDGNNTTVDSSKITAAQNAAANAQTIAAKYNGKTDYEKIVGYCKEICALTAYNDAAANDATKPPYGDPWQLVWVFDKDDDTKVVCEGYSKAFQYVCDLGDVECYTVTGTMSGGTGAGGHMWNVVVLGGVSYLVDITNCDDGTIGNPDKLLLKGATTSTASGCTFEDINLTYKYDDDIIFPASILKVSTEDYTPPVHEHEWETEWTSDGTGHWHACKDKTCKEKNNFAAHTPGAEATEDAPQTCTVCGYEIAPALEHTHEWSTEWESDETGHWYPCTKCDTGKDSFAKHAETAGDNGVEAACTTDGREADTVCSVCGYIIKEGEVIPKTGHTPGEPVQENVVGATCTTAGSYDEVVYCENCNEKLSRKTVTGKTLPHEMEEVAGSAKAATCGEAGKEADKKCKNCDHTETGDTIPATGNHTEGEPKRINTVAATCTAEGSYDEVIECTVCRKELSKEHKTIEKIPHTPGTPEKENEVPATCTKDGSYDMVTRCEVCKEVTDTEHTVVPALGHIFGDMVRGETTHYQKCLFCGTKVGEAAHTKDSGTVTTAPTEGAPGERTYSCTVCGKVLDTEVIPALEEGHEHSYTIKNSDASSHWNECVCGEKDPASIAAHTPDTKEEIALEAVCNVKGLKYVITYCTDCDREISRVPTVIPKTNEHTAGADYENDSDDHWNTCTVCGTVMNKAPHEAGPAATETIPQTCTVCGYEMAPVLAHTHTYATTWTHDDNFHWHAATCQHTNEVSGKAVHAWDSGVITTQPTETTKGVRTFTCTVCNAAKTEPVSELAHTHTPSEAWRFNSAGHWHACGSCDEKLNFAAHNVVSEVTVAPTVTVSGTRRYYCSVCRHVIREEVIPATGVDVQPSTPIAAPVIPTWINSSTASTEPVLDNGSGKSGWKRIANDIKSASNGDAVYVDMNGTTTLSRIALRELIGKNVDLVLKLNGDITWTINGETVTKTSDVNMNAKLNTNNIPNKITEKLSEDGKVVQVSLSHSGSFGFDAVMTVYLGTKYNGKYANLMYYNPTSGAAEFIDCSFITGGSASLDFTHASEYAIVISDEPMGAYEDVSAAAGAFESRVNVSSAAYVSIIAVVAAAMVIFRKKARK